MAALRRDALPLALLLPALAAAGCGGAERVDSDPHWPLAWHGLDLYRHEGEFAYASSGGAAAEVCALAREVAGDFRERTGAEPVAWIHIAVDRGDPSIVAASGTGYGVLLEAMARVIPGGGGRPGEPELPGEVPSEVVYAPVPFILPLGTLGPVPGAGPPHRAETLLPTAGRIAESVDALVDAALEEEGIGFWQRLLIAPFLPFAKGKAREKTEGFVRVALYAFQAASQSQWTSEERAAQVDRSIVSLGLRDPPDLGPLPPDDLP